MCKKRFPNATVTILSSTPADAAECTSNAMFLYYAAAHSRMGSMHLKHDTCQKCTGSVAYTVCVPSMASAQAQDHVLHAGAQTKVAASWG